ncbi:hypothetical protein MCHI_002783 [Candidatus Magnetoovum chiemensis]|nr:hypothetical protein MCHI_002783 [Candidatus Magnetoovum chiemensis]
MWKQTDVDEVLVCLIIDEDAQSAGKLVLSLGSGSYDGGSVSNALIGSEAQAKTYGEKLLFDNYYDVRKVAVETPYLALFDGDAATISDARFGTARNGIIRKADVKIAQANNVCVISQSLEVNIYEKNPRLQ